MLAIKQRHRRLTLVAPTVAALLACAGCFNFHLVGPEDPEPPEPPALVDVTIEYEQPKKCVTDTACDGPVVFYGSWMQQGAEFPLTPVGATRIWRGTAVGVPVNFPPSGTPHLVHVQDPYLRDSDTRGMTSERLKVGGEALRDHWAEGTPHARSPVYIDQNGQGRNVS
jgi:hypothetical protein